MPRWTSVQRLASSGKEERITGNEWAIPIALLCKSGDDVRELYFDNIIYNKKKSLINILTRPLTIIIL